MKNRIVNIELTVLIVLTAMIIITACSNNVERPIIRSQELSGEVTIAINYDTFSSASNFSTLPYEPKAEYAYMPIHNRILQFIEKHPKVSVKIINTEWNIFINRTSIYHAPPDFTMMPDIIELTPHQVRWMTRNEGVQDLSFYIENMSGSYDWGNEYKTLIDKVNVDGKTYLLPVSSDPMIAFYNALTFERLGISPPANEWTWDDFLGLANRLKHEGQLTGVLKSVAGTGVVSVDNIEPIITSFGGQYMSSGDAIFEGYLNSTATEQAFKLYIQHFNPILESNFLWAKGQNKTDTQYPALGIGRASNTFRILDQIDPLATINPVNRGFEVMPLPSSATGEKYNTSMVTGLAMTNVAQDKQLAWELMRFIVGEDDEHPMHLVTVTPLMVAERRFFSRPPEKLSELIRLIRAETNEATLSSLAMVPTYFYSNVYSTEPDQYDRSLWFLDLDSEVSDDELTSEVRSYLLNLLESLENMRDEMIEKGFVFPQRDY